MQSLIFNIEGQKAILLVFSAKFHQFTTKGHLKGFSVQTNFAAKSTSMV